MAVLDVPVGRSDLDASRHGPGSQTPDRSDAQAWSDRPGTEAPRGVAGRQPPVGEPVARIVAVLLALVVLFLGADGAFSAAKQGMRAVHPSRYTGDYAQETRMETLRRQLSDEVPAGSTVFIAHNNGTSGLWRQRLVEFSTMAGIIVVTSEAGADYVVSVVSSPSSPGGLGLSVGRNG